MAYKRKADCTPAEWAIFLAKQNAKSKKYRERHREAFNAYHRAWQTANAERLSARKRERRAADPDKAKHVYRRDNLRRKFGITPHEYELLLNAQGGVCAICKRPSPNGRRLAVDHNHNTGANRGLLCGACNMAIGLLELDPNWCDKAINYLSSYIEQTIGRS